MSDKLPDWKPFHIPGAQSGPLAVYSHNVLFDVVPYIESDGIFSEAGAKALDREITSRAKAIARIAPSPFYHWDLVREEVQKGIIRQFLNAFGHFNGLITLTRYRILDEMPSRSSRVWIDIGMSSTGAPILSFMTIYDFAGRVVHDAIEMAAKRPRMKVDFGDNLKFTGQVDALMIALTMFPHEFFEKINEWLLPGVYIDFNERESQGNPCTQFGVMSPNKRNIAHVDLPSARAAHEAALSKGNKEPWTRTRFTIGGTTA